MSLLLIKTTEMLYILVKFYSLCNNGFEIHNHLYILHEIFFDFDEHSAILDDISMHLNRIFNFNQA